MQGFQAWLWSNLIRWSLVVGSISAWAQSGPPQVVDGGILVKLKVSKVSQDGFSFMSKAIAAKGLALKSSYDQINVHHFAVKAGDDYWGTLSELRADPAVEYAEPDYELRAFENGFGEVEGDVESLQDAELRALSAYSSSSYGLTTAPVRILEAWGVATAGATPPVVAIVDSGVDYNHSVFTGTGAIWNNSDEVPNNGIDDDGNGYVDDIRGWNFVSNSNNPMDDSNHGTHVAGIVLAVNQDIYTTPYSAARVKIMPLKFLNASGSGTISAAVAAIYYAVNNGANVINNSWGGGSFSYSLQDAIRYAYDNKVSVIAAAGNSSTNIDNSPVYPAAYASPGLIAVAATTGSDSWASFSNWGTSRVHVAAPGAGVYSTLPNSTFGVMSGTSMATPMVAGLAAAMLREQPTMNSFQLKNILVGNAKPFSFLASRVSTGARIDFYPTILNSKSTSVSSSQPVYQYQSGVDVTDSRPASVQPPSGGCGTVASVAQLGKSGQWPPSQNTQALAAILLIPVALFFALRGRERRGIERRGARRWDVNAPIQLWVDGIASTVQLTSLSLSGAQVALGNADLFRGRTLRLRLPGQDPGAMSMEAEVVWNSADQRAGLRFTRVPDSAHRALVQWLHQLQRAG